MDVDLYELPDESLSSESQAKIDDSLQETHENNWSEPLADLNQEVCEEGI